MAEQAQRDVQMAATAEENRGGADCSVANGAVPMGCLWVDFLGEQARYSLEITHALRRATVWEHALQAHSILFRASFEYWVRAGSDCLEIIQSVAKLPDAARRDVKVD